MRKPGQRGKAIPDGNGISPPTAEEVGLKIRRLVAIRLQRVPVWREE